MNRTDHPLRTNDWYLVQLPLVLVGVVSIATIGVVVYLLAELVLPSPVAGITAAFATGLISNRLIVETLGALIWQHVAGARPGWPRAAVLTLIAATTGGLGLALWTAGPAHQ